jgi:hypothetical protein
VKEPEIAEEPLIALLLVKTCVVQAALEYTVKVTEPVGL